MNEFSSLKVIFPGKKIFLRLGGHLTRSRMPQEEMRRFNSLALKAFEFCHPRGRWDIVRVKKITGEGILLSDDCWIGSRDFAARCAGSTHLWYGAVTVGAEVVALRDTAEKVSESTVYDAVGAETADAAMDLLHRMAGKQLQRQAMVLADRRYSPGYGDMSLEIQHFFFERLKLAELGLSLSEAYYMIPEKSVTAFAAVREEL